MSFAGLRARLVHTFARVTVWYRVQLALRFDQLDLALTPNLLLYQCRPYCSNPIPKPLNV